MFIRKKRTSATGLSEAELLLRLRAGDERAFEEAFYRYYNHLYAIGMQFLRSPDLTQDAIQDIYLRLWHHRARLNDAYSMKAFLAVSMKNHVLNLLRDNGRAVLEALPAPDAEPLCDDTTRQLQWQEYTDILEEGLRQLSPQKQLVFRLKVFNGLDNEQVAEQLSVSVNTVKTHYAQASQFIRTYLDKRAQLKDLLLWLILLDLSA